METVQASGGLDVDALWESGYRPFNHEEKCLGLSVIFPAQSGTSGVDALVHFWTWVHLYTFPLLARISLTHYLSLSLILIASNWLEKHCLAEII